jgi:DNA-directed RNA polymerase specialized sigma24 family protein
MTNEAWLHSPGDTRIRTAAVPESSTSEPDLLPELQRGLTFILRRRLRAEDVDHAVQHVLKVTLPQIRKGNMTDNTAILQFVRTIAVSYAETFTARYDADAQGNGTPGHKPESDVLVRSVLTSLDERTREILHRYYVQEQSTEQIGAELNIPVHTVDAAKAKAKQLLAERLSVKPGPRARLLTRLLKVRQTATMRFGFARA